MSPEVSLELISGDGLNAGVSVTVSFPPVCCSLEQLVCYKKHLFTIGTLGYLQLLLNGIQPIQYIHRILGLSEGVGASPQKFTQPRLGWWWRWC
jgi:hypothetical protein